MSSGERLELRPPPELPPPELRPLPGLLSVPAGRLPPVCSLLPTCALPSEIFFSRDKGLFFRSIVFPLFYAQECYRLPLHAG